MTIDEMRDVIGEIKYKSWKFHLGRNGCVCWLQVRFLTVDSVTNKVQTMHGRKWLLSEHMTKSEIVLTAFKAVLTAEEHEVREAFLYFGKAIFNPHISVDQFLEISHIIDARVPRRNEDRQDA